MRILPSSDLPAELESHDAFGAAHGDLQAEIQALAALKAVRCDGLDGLRALAGAASGTADVSEPAPIRRLSAAEVTGALAALTDRQARALTRVAGRQRVYARRQARSLREFRYAQGGITLGQRVVPIQRLGFVVSADQGPVAVLALAALAQAVHVPEVAFVFAPAPGVGAASGALPQVLAAAASVAGAREVHLASAQVGVAALALGAGEVARADKLIVLAAAEANVYARAAARLLPVWCRGSDPGFSLVVVAGSGARSDLVAADVAAERERSPLSRVAVVAWDRALLDAVSARLAAGGAPGGATDLLGILAESQENALAAAEILAPARLSLHLPRAASHLRGLRHCGVLFAGALCPPALADTSLGLPPSGSSAPSARASGGLSVLDLVTLRPLAHLDRRGLARVRGIAEGLGGLADTPQADASLQQRGGPRRVGRGIIPPALRDEGLEQS